MPTPIILPWTGLPCGTIVLELRDKLAERGCDKELQDRVLAALRERHFVDDVRCAGYCR